MSSPNRSMRLVLELDADSEPIRGTVSDPDGVTRRCVGWLALIGAVEDMRKTLIPSKGTSVPVGRHDG